jgi:hypothetical protein
MTGLLGIAREGLDAIKYKKTKEGKAEAKARREHNKKFSPNLDAKTKRKLRADAKKADAAKGALLSGGGLARRKRKRKNA